MQSHPKPSEVGDPDLDPSDTDGADEQAHAVLLANEHVLDRWSQVGAIGIGPGDVLGQSTRQAQ